MPSNGKLTKWLFNKAVVEPVTKKVVEPTKAKVTKSKPVAKLKGMKPGKCFCGKAAKGGGYTCGRIECNRIIPE